MIEFIARNGRKIRKFLFKLKTEDANEHYKNLKTNTTD